MNRVHIKIIATAVIAVTAVSLVTYNRIRKLDAGTANPNSIQKAKNSTTSVTDAHANRVRIIATGDFIPHDAINQEAKKSDGTYDYSSMMSNMKPVFAAADIRFCNQATGAAGAAFGITGYPVFNAPLEFTRDMDKLGCNLINVGSNHSNDKGQAAISAQLDEWDKQPGILAIGGEARSATEQQKIGYFTIKGVRFAFLSYVTYSNTHNMTAYGVNMFNRTTAAAQLVEARKQADIIIVSMRWGTEYSNGINSEQISDGQFLADNGSDIILGHGPHSLEPVKKLTGQNGRSSYVWYSLGNFLNAQLELESLFTGLAVMDIDASSKQITNVSYLPIYMHYEWTAAQAAAQDLLARKNFKLYLLEDAATPLAKSQNKTTIEAQKTRIQNLLNTYTPVPVITSKDES